MALRFHNPLAALGLKLQPLFILTLAGLASLREIFCPLLLPRHPPASFSGIRHK